MQIEHGPEFAHGVLKFISDRVRNGRGLIESRLEAACDERKFQLAASLL
jgi:hypothetical protein